MHLKAGFNVKVHTEPFPDDEIRGQLQLDDKSVSHTTQQFFLTKRSLFVLVWDIRHGWEAGKLYNWLDRIQAIAPESPVMDSGHTYPVARAAVGTYTGPIGTVMGAKYAKDLAGQIKLMEELAKKLAERD